MVPVGSVTVMLQCAQCMFELHRACLKLKCLICTIGAIVRTYYHRTYYHRSAGAGSLANLAMQRICPCTTGRYSHVACRGAITARMHAAFHIT